MWYRKAVKPSVQGNENSLQQKDAFGSLIDHFFDGWDLSPAFFGKQNDISEKLVPMMNISERESAYEVEMELPGVKKEDIKLDINDNILTIKGEKKGFSEEKKDEYHRIERTHGSFQRSVRLPADIDMENVSAKIDHGVLHIEVAKCQKEKETKRSIAIS